MNLHRSTLRRGAVLALLTSGLLAVASFLFLGTASAHCGCPHDHEEATGGYFGDGLFHHGIFDDDGVVPGGPFGDDGYFGDGGYFGDDGPLDGGVFDDGVFGDDGVVPGGPFGDDGLFDDGVFDGGLFDDDGVAEEDAAGEVVVVEDADAVVVTDPDAVVVTDPDAVVVTDDTLAD